MYKRNLTEEIQRDKSEDSSAKSTTYILLQNRAEKRRMGMLYNGGDLGWKGTVAVQCLTSSTMGFERLQRASKRY